MHSQHLTSMALLIRVTDSKLAYRLGDRFEVAEIEATSRLLQKASQLRVRRFKRQRAQYKCDPRPALRPRQWFDGNESCFLEAPDKRRESLGRQLYLRPTRLGQQLDVGGLENIGLTRLSYPRSKNEFELRLGQEYCAFEVLAQERLHHRCVNLVSLRLEDACSGQPRPHRRHILRCRTSIEFDGQDLKSWHLATLNVIAENGLNEDIALTCGQDMASEGHVLLRAREAREFAPLICEYHTPVLALVGKTVVDESLKHDSPYRVGCASRPHVQDTEVRSQ